MRFFSSLLALTWSLSWSIDKWSKVNFVDSSNYRCQFISQCCNRERHGYVTQISSRRWFIIRSMSNSHLLFDRFSTGSMWCDNEINGITSGRRRRQSSSDSTSSSSRCTSESLRWKFIDTTSSCCLCRPWRSRKERKKEKCKDDGIFPRSIDRRNSSGKWCGCIQTR